MYHCKITDYSSNVDVSHRELNDWRAYTASLVSKARPYTALSSATEEKIFELFFSTKHSSGFGLWSARRHVLKNRGKLDLSSEPDHGTTFTILLPKVEDKAV